MLMSSLWLEKKRKGVGFVGGLELGGRSTGALVRPLAAIDVMPPNVAGPATFRNRAGLSGSYLTSRYLVVCLTFLIVLDFLE